MFFGFQLTCGLMMVFYGYTVMKNPRVWGEQGRRAVKAEHFDDYCRQNGLFFLKAGCIMSVIAALDALFTLDAVLYVLLYLFGLAFSFSPLVKWCQATFLNSIRRLLTFLVTPTIRLTIPVLYGRAALPL